MPDRRVVRYAGPNRTPALPLAAPAEDAPAQDQPRPVLEQPLLTDEEMAALRASSQDALRLFRSLAPRPKA